MDFFQAEDGIRDRSPSRGLGDVYKRQTIEPIMREQEVLEIVQYMISLVMQPMPLGI